MKDINKKLLGALLSSSVVIFAGVSISGCTTEDSDAINLYQNADVYRGGNLYDEWFEVPKVKEGIAPGDSVIENDETITSSLPAENPLYVSKGPGEESGAATWRCVSCHGYDFKGKDGVYATGFKGVLGTTKTITELFDVIKNGTGVSDPKSHSFGTVLADEDIANLVKFVKEGTVDESTLVKDDKSALGDPAIGKTLYEGNCGTCHGADGMKKNFHQSKPGYQAEYFYTVATQDPWEFIQKARFGLPEGGVMPNGGAKGYVLEDISNILAYAQTLAPKGLEGASALRGGVLYDNWIAETGATDPTTTNAAYPSSGAKSGADTWRCKECHGWDYKGVDGRYGSGSHFTGIKGLWGAQDWDPADLLAIIADGKKKDGSVVDGHAFVGTDLLSGDDAADLALFIKTGLVDDDQSISPITGRAKGSSAAGHGLWETNCETCHGDLGTNINFGHDEGPLTAEYVATVARENPWELIHKIRWGQPGSDNEAAEMEEMFGIVTGHMPNAIDAGYSEAQISQVLAFAQTLPSFVERGGLAWDQWWEVRGVAENIEPGGSITDADGNTVMSSLPRENPLYASAGTGTVTGPKTWTCVKCHGWDFKGSNGIKGVLNTSMTPEELYAAIFDGEIATGKNLNHAFGAVLGDWVTRDLVNFLTADPNEEVGAPRDIAASLIESDPSSPDYGDVLPFAFATDPNRTREANYNLGRIKFESVCANCHGLDGRAINFHESKGDEEYISTIANEDPWELLGKVLHGVPGSEPVMINAAGQGWDLDDVADILLYTKDLP